MQCPMPFICNTYLPHEVVAWVTSSKWQGWKSTLGLWIKAVCSFVHAASISTLHIYNGVLCSLFELCKSIHSDTAVWILVGCLRMWKWWLVALVWEEHVVLELEKLVSIIQLDSQREWVTLEKGGGVIHHTILKKSNWAYLKPWKDSCPQRKKYCQSSCSRVH